VLNRVILIGRLANEPELRYSSNDIPYCTFTLAVNRTYANAAGGRAADFIDIIAWRQLAENCASYLSKGRLVAVEGRLQARTYETQDGKKRKVIEVVADSVRFLERGQKKQGPEDEGWGDIGTMVEDEPPF